MERVINSAIENGVATFTLSHLASEKTHSSPILIYRVFQL